MYNDLNSLGDRAKEGHGSERRHAGTGEGISARIRVENSHGDRAEEGHRSDCRHSANSLWERVDSCITVGASIVASIHHSTVRRQLGAGCGREEMGWRLFVPTNMCLLLCFIKPILGKRYGPGVIPSSRGPGVAGSSPFTLTTSLVTPVPSSSSSNGPTTTPLTTRGFCPGCSVVWAGQNSFGLIGESPK